MPPPHGDAVTDFSGFIEEPTSLVLQYYPGVFFPLTSGQSTTFTAVTPSSNGQSWSDGAAGLFLRRPVRDFWSLAPVDGGCGMSQWQQSVLVGCDRYRRVDAMALGWSDQGGPPMCEPTTYFHAFRR